MDTEEKKRLIRSPREFGPAEWFVVGWVVLFLAVVYEALSPYFWRFIP